MGNQKKSLNYDGYYNDIKVIDESEEVKTRDKSAFIKVGIVVFFTIIIVALSVVVMKLAG